MNHLEKQFQCRFCDKKFRFNKKLEDHEKTHRDIKDIKCPHCPSLFRSRTVMKKHVNASFMKYFLIIRI